MNIRIGLVLLLLVILFVGCDKSPIRQVFDVIEKKGVDKSNGIQENQEEKSKGIQESREAKIANEVPEDSGRLVEQGIKYIEHGKIPNGIEKLERAVALGNVKAMVALAMLYREGKLIEPDAKKSFSLLRDAAQKDSPEAMALVSGCYKKGIGTQVDEEKSRYWLKKAVDADYAPVMLLIARDRYWAARLTFTKTEKAQIIKEAISLLDKIKNGKDETSVEANLLLGRIYMDGVGVDVDAKLGKSYYEKCIVRNNLQAMQELGEAYCKGKSLKRDYGKGIDLILKSLSGMKEDRNVCEVLGNAYLDPEWSGFNLAEGVKYLEKAVQMEAHDSQIANTLYTLGMIYAFEERSLARVDRGIKFLERAAEENVGEAAYYLAVLYFNGDGVEKDMFKSSRYAAEARRSLHVSSRIQNAAIRLEQAITKIRGY